MFEAAGLAGRHHPHWSSLHSTTSSTASSASACWPEPSPEVWSDAMPSYTPLHWGDSTRYRKKVSMESSDMLWQDSLGSCSPWTTPTTEFPWDKFSIMDDRNIPWQTPHTYPSEPYDCAPLGTAKPRISDISVTLDPNKLVPPSASKYQPLRESPTPPKSKKKCTKNRNNFDETSFRKPNEPPNVHNMNQINLCVDSGTELERRLSYQRRMSHSGSTDSDRSLGSPEGVSVNQSAVYSGPVNCAIPSSVGNHCQQTTTASTPCIDTAAFERYYEGSLLGANCPPSLPTRSSRPPAEEQGVCGGLGPLSLALALPGKLEGLLKLLAQSLHLVLAGFCSRLDH